MIHFHAYRIYTIHLCTKLDRSFIDMNTVGHSSDEILSLTPGTIVCQKAVHYKPFFKVCLYQIFPQVCTEYIHSEYNNSHTLVDFTHALK